MDSILEKFEERTQEIDEYLKLIELISEPDARIHRQGKRPKRIENIAIKTMKASCFLMLYNLVESSIRDSLATLYEKINAENHDLASFKACVKEIWIAQNFRKKIDPLSSNHSSYLKLVKEMVGNILASNPIFLDPKELQISGNLDARRIREIFLLHQIPTKVHYRAVDGGELKTVKDKRNSLAHGNIGFADCGQEYSIQDIIRIKKQTVVYLRSSLKNVKKYLERTQYAA
ncbi:MAE_28990/MAE_18760 family HEPN-like nuclease [Microbulbifer rhizosphaerae]|uniref:MAE-28990/MAE-18760-like HEPN domain-containing protein n=1 Tax=Microbulbifer rhizosphaerae TaxID=1562603 RepID=A0A7W4Z9K8_9GAMM|nr:MAE_28990/MAE_18760 family HEPN-like nuclease [Microbulbifer rhizosphaerae]MBB3060344.1 hypothetical protein [Microbulbifer rhizosphaerae]